MNIGFLEALKQYDYECFIFHDVDLIPEDDRNLYTCPEQPRHMSVAIDKFSYRYVTHRQRQRERDDRPRRASTPILPMALQIRSISVLNRKQLTINLVFVVHYYWTYCLPQSTQNVTTLLVCPLSCLLPQFCVKNSKIFFLSIVFCVISLTLF